ncbi:MOSC domain-containing protein [Pelagibaculum spongiae]|uniref:MOSC domain-containing protein n=1 Tax=Pelagibaculum spongiae TaxID=2080658 RepID=A0A2V1GXW3_9GAMM|nr:MOSC N-terminal beta barrel domain-containing protein [Pelagibaculum spongiae]PVZ69495.1 MOSC domain-containing protein [Pelagibaculum spongiae]
MKLHQIFIYPVKSCRGIALTKANVGRFGLEWDRRWMIVDANGSFLTQRKHSKMAMIQPHLSDSGVLLNAPNMPELEIVSDGLGEDIQVEVWGDQVLAENCGQQAAQWWSEYLGEPATMVFMPDHGLRQVSLKYAEQGNHVGFADGFSLLVISKSSLDDLNQHLSEDVDMRRFRPNIVVDDCEAFAEDTIKKLQINDIEFSVVKPCSRCVMLRVNPDTGMQDKIDPLTALAKYRRDLFGHKGIFFGQNLVHHKEGEIAVGNEIKLLGLN